MPSAFLTVSPGGSWACRKTTALLLRTCGSRSILSSGTVREPSGIGIQLLEEPLPGHEHGLDSEIEEIER